MNILQKHKNVVLMGVSALFIVGAIFFLLKNQLVETIVFEAKKMQTVFATSASQAVGILAVVDENKPIEAFPRVPVTGKTTRYDIRFPISQEVEEGGRIFIYVPTGFSFVSTCGTAVDNPFNKDINGIGSGTVTMNSVSCDSETRTITIETAGAAIQSGDYVQLSIQGIVNSSVASDPTTDTGYVIAIQTKTGSSDDSLEFLRARPFFLIEGGSQTISGTTFMDDGYDGGTASDGIQNGSESGISSISVCISAQFGNWCVLTDVDGDYTFTNLKDGNYVIDVPPIPSGTFVGGPFRSTVSLVSGASQKDIDFGFQTADGAITVNINGIPTGTNLDVVAVGASNEVGGNIVREVLWNGSSNRSITLPLRNGEWQVSIEPWEEKGEASCDADAVASFVKPLPQKVLMESGSALDITFAMSSQTMEIRGKVIDGYGNAIGQAFVVARPTSMTTDTGGESTYQTGENGLFYIPVSSGTYSINVFAQGMQSRGEKSVQVTADSGNVGTDNNSTADVYYLGSLIINDYDYDADDLVFKLVKGGQSISGVVLNEDGEAIAYAHVMAEKIDTSGNFLNSFVETSANVSGTYTLFVSSGMWTVKAFSKDYGQIDYETVTIAESSVSNVNLQAGSASFGIVSGSVTQGGTAVSGVFIDVFGPNGANHGKTDSDGSYSIRVPAGSGYSISGYANSVGGLSSISNVVVTAGQTNAGNNFTLSGKGTIQTTISGVTDAFVEAFDSAGIGSGTGSSDTGVYSISVPAGTYTVKAHSRAYGFIGSQTGISVTAGQTSTVTLSPSSLYTVSGTVSSSSDICKNNASVHVVNATSKFANMTQTNASGAFSISLPNGTYEVVATKAGCTDTAAPGTITVSNANVSSGANRTLEAGNTSIVGAVSLGGSNTTIPTKVVAINENNILVSSDVDTSITSGANYTLNVRAGTWTVTAYSDGYDSTSQTIAVTSGSQTLNISLAELSGFTSKAAEITTMRPSEGGIVRDTNIGDDFKVRFPAGSLGLSCTDGSVSTKYTTAIPKEAGRIRVVGGKAVDITPKDSEGRPITTLSSSEGATLTIPYSESDLTALGASESDVQLATWSEESQQWEPLATTVDEANNAISGSSTHFSIFAPVVIIGDEVPAVEGGGDGDPTPTPPTVSTGGKPTPQPKTPEQPDEPEQPEQTDNTPKPTPEPTPIKITPKEIEVTPEPQPSKPQTKQTKKPTSKQTTSAVFEPKIKLSIKNPFVQPGQELSVQGKITGLSSIYPNARIVHYIKTMDGKVLETDSEVITAYNELAYNKKFVLPLSIPIDRYLVMVELHVGEKNAYSAQYFEVEKLVYEQPITNETSNIGEIPVVSYARIAGISLRTYWLMIILLISLSILHTSFSHAEVKTSVSLK